MKSFEAKSKLLNGSLWVFFGYGLSQFIRLASNLLLAHLLVPETFGMMSLVTVVMQGITMISDLGIGPSIIHSPRGDDPKFLNTAWTVQAIRGISIWIILCLLAYPFTRYFGHDAATRFQLMQVLPVIGFSSVISGFNSTSIFLLNRKMRMGVVTFLDLFPQVISVLVMYAWAKISPSVWALAAGLLVYSAVKLPLTHYLNQSERNRFCFEKDSLKELRSFGQWVLLGTIVSFFATNLDRLILAKLLTLAELGVYSMALTFARFGTEISTRLATYVLFPVLARSQSNPVLLVDRSLKARGAILDVAGPLIVAFVILSPLFFHHFYNHKYANAGWIAQWLGIAVWCSVLLNSMEKVPMALGHSKASFVSNVICCFGYVLAIPFYHIIGLPGFILGTSLGLVASHLSLLLWIPVRRCDMLLQSLWYTLGFSSYTLLVIFIMMRLKDGESSSTRYTVILAFIPCVWGFFRLMKHLRFSGVGGADTVDSPVLNSSLVER